MNDIQLLYIDLFCGAGGTSTGVEGARHDGRKCAKVIACVNHDANAIASHAANHPDAVHFTEDYTLVGTQAEQKKYIGNAVEVNMARVLCEALCEKLSND
jgi:site-specific DNA-cytosine methylase